MKIVWTLAGAALAVALAGTAAADEPKEKKVEKMVILTSDGHDAGAADGEKRHRIHVLAEGAGCQGSKDEVTDESADGGRKTRIMVCSTDTLSAADRAARLETVLARIQSEDGLSAEQKARIEGALRQKIDQLKSGQ